MNQRYQQYEGSRGQYGDDMRNDGRQGQYEGQGWARQQGGGQQGWGPNEDFGRQQGSHSYRGLDEGYGQGYGQGYGYDRQQGWDERQGDVFGSGQGYGDGGRSSRGGAYGYAEQQGRSPREMGWTASPPGDYGLRRGGEAPRSRFGDARGGPQGGDRYEHLREWSGGSGQRDFARQDRGGWEGSGMQGGGAMSRHGGASQGYGGQGYGGGHGGSESWGAYGTFGESSRQSHRGKGPKGYKRSDERLQEDINERLMDDDAIDASEVTVRCEDGVVTLEGRVSERRVKHRIEDLVERCHGVQDIENRISVKRGDSGNDSRVGAMGDGDRNESSAQHGKKKS